MLFFVIIWEKEGSFCMKIYSIIFSPTGGTKKSAQLLTAPWENVCAIDMITDTDKLDNISLNADDVVYISVPSFGGRVPTFAAEQLKNIKGNNALSVINAVFGNRAYEDTLLELRDIAAGCNMCCVAATATNAQHSIMPQYGTGRPDNEDKAELTDFALKIKDKIESGSFTEVTVPGNRPYKVLGKASMLPQADEQCSHCGKCANECPTGAIFTDAPNITNADKCIQCLHCIATCPSKARSLDKDKVQALAEKMKPLFAERKKNELFI